MIRMLMTIQTVKAWRRLKRVLFPVPLPPIPWEEL